MGLLFPNHLGLPFGSLPSPAAQAVAPAPSRSELPGGAPAPSRNLASEVPLVGPTSGSFRSQTSRRPSTCPQRPSPPSCPGYRPTKRPQKFCQPARTPRLKEATNLSPFLRPQTARTRRLLSPRTQAIPTLWPPTASASVSPRGQEALLPNSTASGPRISSPLGPRTPLTPAGRNRAEDGAG